MRKSVILTIVLFAGAAFAADTDVTLPTQVPDLLALVLGNKVLDVAKYMVYIQSITQLVKMIAVQFKTRLPAKYKARLVAVLGLMLLCETVTADGFINGSDWSNLLMSVVATLGAFYSYKVSWSSTAKVNQ